MTLRKRRALPQNEQDHSQTPDQKLNALSDNLKNYLLPGGIGLIIAGIIVSILPAILTSNALLRLFSVDVIKPNEIGDTIGGTVGPAVGLLGAVLTFLAFYIQIKANNEQRLQFLKADKDTSVQRFENKFYILLELHRQNVDEISIDNKINGRRAFISMYLELRFLYHAVTTFYAKKFYSKKDAYLISDEMLFQISYLIFFFGVGKNSSPMVADLIGAKFNLFLRKLEKELNGHQAIWKKHYDANIELLAQNRKYHSITVDGKELELNILYRPFTGHVARLSHYIRHIFQTVKFVDDQDDSVIDWDAKYSYITNLRAQLSVHEQVLIYYNSLSVLGHPWRGQSDSNNKDYLIEYALVKSMPLPLANFYKQPIQDQVLPEEYEGRKMFEWTEIKSRLSNI